ncbi:MAG TPA: hypothetical protein VE545_08475 [Candidatus Dormibacteraeota bacterium]|nr:hypothetical protein [Candidatus Dormibacteraeota bacterium]
MALRLFAAKRIFRGISAGRWAAFLGAVASAIKLVEVSIRVVRKEAPAGHILLPAIIFIQLLRVSIAGASRMGLLVFAAVFEIGVVVFALSLLRRAGARVAGSALEDHFERVFAQFLPERIAALMARDVVLLWEGLRWAARGFRPVPVAGFGYLEQSVIAILPIAAPILAIADEVVLGVVLRHQALWIRLGIVGLDIWAIVYVFGIYATCQARPHQVTSQSVRLEQGIFGRCEFDPALLVEASPEPELIRKDPGAVRLTLKGSPAVKVQLSHPVTVKRMLRGEQQFQTLLVSADDPGALCRALREARASAKAGA